MYQNWSKAIELLRVKLIIPINEVIVLYEIGAKMSRHKTFWPLLNIFFFLHKRSKIIDVVKQAIIVPIEMREADGRRERKSISF